MSAAPAKNTFFVPLVSGGMAGIAVDVSLFPLDTLKVRFLFVFSLFSIYLGFVCFFFTNKKPKSHHFSPAFLFLPPPTTNQPPTNHQPTTTTRNIKTPARLVSRHQKVS
jgi:hypothetical protein